MTALRLMTSPWPGRMSSHTSEDAARIRDEKRLAIEARQPSELIMVEVRV